MAELALAIIPLCLGAMKGIGTVREKLNLLRHHSSEIKRLRKKFKTQTCIFLDECQLLLQKILDPKEAEALVECIDHPEWNNPELDNAIKAYLGRRKYEDFGECVDEIKGHILSLSNSFRINTDVNPEVRTTVTSNLQRYKGRFLTPLC